MYYMLGLYVYMHMHMHILKSEIMTCVVVRLYSSIVIPTWIYASETWKTTNKINKLIGVFHRRCLRSILGISWRDHITTPSIDAYVGLLEEQSCQIYLSKCHVSLFSLVIHLDYLFYCVLSMCVIESYDSR